jgi:hypothetical protein
MPTRGRRPFDVVLAATLHDDRGALLDDVARFLPRLLESYRGIAVTTTPATARRMNAALEAAGVHAGTPASNRRGALYRLAVRRARELGAGHVHYLDFDRALHWIRRAPRELRAVLRLVPGCPAVIVGRTEKAHRSHHTPLYATETLASRLLASSLGVGGRFDLLVPSFVVTAEVAGELVRRSRTRDAGVYGEWPVLLAALAPEVGYVECRGLDWETPDRHRRAVRRVGLPAWRRRWSNSAEWEARVEMAAVIVRAAAATVARRPARFTVRRIAPRIG